MATKRHPFWQMYGERGVTYAEVEADVEPRELWNGRGGDAAYAAWQADSGERREMPSMEYILAHPIAAPFAGEIPDDDGVPF